MDVRRPQIVVLALHAGFVVVAVMIVMAVIAATVFVVYRIIGVYGERWGMSAQRAHRFTQSSWLALGWVVVALGDYALRHRGGR